MRPIQVSVRNAANSNERKSPERAGNGFEAARVSSRWAKNQTDNCATTAAAGLVRRFVSTHFQQWSVAPKILKHLRSGLHSYFGSHKNCLFESCEFACTRSEFLSKLIVSPAREHYFCRSHVHIKSSGLACTRRELLEK